MSESFRALPLWKTHIFERWAAVLGVVTGFASLPKGRQIRVAPPRAPLLILLHVEDSQQADSRFAGGIYADDALASPPSSDIQPAFNFQNLAA